METLWNHRVVRLIAVLCLMTGLSFSLNPLALSSGAEKPSSPNPSANQETPQDASDSDNAEGAKTNASPQNSTLNSDESAARYAFEKMWTETNQAVPFSEGSITASCTPGLPNPQAVAKMLETWNYLRSLNGLSAVKIPANSPATAFAQQAALTAAINSTTNANSQTNKKPNCASAEGRLAAASGVIASLNGIVTPATEILRYVTEASTTNSNDNLGHRLELFAPQQENTAIGAVSIGTSGPCASSIQLFDTLYADSRQPLNPPLWNQTLASPPQITWPSPGFFPTRLLPTGANENISRWSYSAHCADLRKANAKITGPKGEIPLEIIHRDEPGKDPNSTPWDYAGYDTILLKVPLSYLEIPQFYHHSQYRVDISGIQAQPGCEAVPDTASYHVNLFNSSWPADPNGDADHDGIPNRLDSAPLIPDLHTKRLAGSTRIETAAYIAMQTPLRPKKLYLARADVLVDALVGGSLKDGPVLLMPPNEAPLPRIITEVTEALNPEEVVALGGSKAISNTRLFEVAAGRRATRIGGGTRVQTSILVARHSKAPAKSLYLAQAYGPNHQASPDALTGATLPDGPIVLVDSTSPTISTIRQLANDLAVKRIVALGGSAVIPDRLLQEIAVGKPATRLAGSNRYATSLQVALEASRLRSTNHVYLARGDIFADAVAGAKLNDGEIILLPPGCKPLSSEVLKTMSFLRAFQITALGGPDAVCDENLQDSLEWPNVVNDSITEY